MCILRAETNLCAMNALRWMMLCAGVLAASAAGAQEVRGFVCAPAVPECGQTTVDFSRAAAEGEALWRYRLAGDSALSVARRGQGEAVREEYLLKGDSAWLLCRESRRWVSRDSLPTPVWGVAPCEGATARRIRRYRSEHYVTEGHVAFTPVGRCTVILAEGDTARNAVLTHRREVTEVWPADVSYSHRGDSLNAVVTKDIWNWGYGPKVPLLACTEVTVTTDMHTGEVTREEWSAVFPTKENPDVWSETPSAMNKMRWAHGAAAPIVPRERDGGRDGNPGAQEGADGDGAGTRWSEPTIDTGQGRITVTTGPGNAVHVTVTDIAGRVMHECEAAGTVTIATGGWPYGEYVIKAGETVRKMILVP